MMFLRTKLYPSLRVVVNWLIMFVISILIMMLVSRDSYLYMLGPRCDSAWFFMCGKAWMNGMVPYVDFADSKGPLLWLIYGVGYLLSRYDYHGVFWVAVFFYSFTFYFLFKTALIFVNQSKQAILAVLMTSVFIFLPIYHNEIRAEDFCMFFTSLSLWQLCRMLYTEHTESNEQTAFFIFGISLAGTLLIKFNITAMCCVFPAIGLYYLVRKHHPVLLPLLYCVAGFAAIALPFLIYFIIQGNFGAFIQEYFVNTLQTIENKSRSPLFLGLNNKVRLMISYSLTLAFIILISVFGALYLFVYKNTMFIFGLVFFVFTCIVSGASSYYYSICSVFVLYGCCILVNYLTKIGIGKLAIVGVIFLSYIYIIYANRTFLGCGCNKNMEKQIDDVECLISRVDSPKILYLALERGFGIRSNILPSTKYWARQNGATKEMKESALKAISLSDVVVIDGNSSDYIETRKYVLSKGFKHVYYFQRTLAANDFNEIYMKK